MLRIRTLGATEIAVGDQCLGAAQPIAFALLFILAMRGATGVSRRDMAGLLWPTATDVERNHRLRSLLHRVRRMGAPVACSSSVVALADASIDFREFASYPILIGDVRARVEGIGAVLPGLAAPSPALADRLDDARDVIIATMTRWLTAAVEVVKRAGDLPLLDQLTRAARRLDPDTETPWSTEVPCLTSHPAPPQGLFGRDDIMRRIGGAVARAADGRGGAVLLWGPPGIGKTRILDEVERARGIVGARLLRIEARPVHGLRPVAFLHDLVVRLLDAPGAAGCSPAAYDALRRWSGNDLLGDALTELLAAVADEAPLVIACDDMHLVEPGIWRLLRGVLRWSAGQRLLWLFIHRALGEAELAELPEITLVPRVPLRSLDRRAATAFVASLGDFTDEQCERVVDAAGGHPLLLRCVAGVNATSTEDGRTLVDDCLARLSRRALELLQLMGTSGGCAGVQALAELAGATRSQLAAALGELERAGMIREHAGVLHAHSIWSEAALALMAVAERLAFELDRPSLHAALSR